MNSYHFNRYFIERKEYLQRKQFCDEAEKKWRETHTPTKYIDADGVEVCDYGQAFWETEAAQQCYNFSTCANEFFERKQ